MVCAGICSWILALPMFDDFWITCATLMRPLGCESLMVHLPIVIGTMPVDRWLKNQAGIAKQRGIPVIVEYWLAGPSEEVETYTHLAHPLVTLRGLKTIAARK